MRFASAFSIAAVMASSAVYADPSESKPDPLASIACIVGEWTGVGEGQPGVSASVRVTTREHDDQFIRVEGRSVYPRQEKNKTGEVHTSTDWWSFDHARGRIVLRQFDNLGFVSTYVQDLAASTEGRVVLVSEHLENVPAGWRARYAYTCPAEDSYHELFELDSGKGFETYVSGRFLRAKPH